MTNSLVVKSNKLIEARYSLKLNEQKIILYSIGKLDRNKENFNLLKLNVREFTKLLGTTSERYTEIREIVRELRKKEVIIDTDEDELITGWLSSIRYIKDTGEVELEFSEKLIPYLLQLKDKFTRYDLKNILYLKNKYSIRIYELLKQYENIQTREFSIDKLKYILMLEEKQYNRMYDFERFVLKPSMQEINNYTDLKVTYEKLTRGRKIVGIKFHINSKEDNLYIEYLNQTYNIKEFKENSGIEQENFNSKQVLDLYEIAVDMLIDDYEDDTDLFEYIKINYLHMANKKNIKNRFSYLKKALKEDYAAARGQIKFNVRIPD